MEFFKSDDVKVFPCARRGAKTESGEIEKIFDAESRLNTEYNLTHLHGINGGTFYSYVHKYELNEDKTLKSGSTLVAIVGGYYFEIYLSEEYLENDGILTKEAIGNNSGVWLNVGLIEKKLDADNETKLIANLKTTDSDQLDEKENENYYFRGLGVSYAEDNKQEFSIQILDEDAHFIQESTKSISPDKIGLKSLIIKEDNTDIIAKYNGMDEISICPGSGINISNDNINNQALISVKVQTDGGLQTAHGGLGINTASKGGLTTGEDGLKIKLEPNCGLDLSKDSNLYVRTGVGITKDASGNLKLATATSGGLTVNCSGLKVNTGDGLTINDNKIDLNVSTDLLTINEQNGLDVTEKIYLTKGEEPVNCENKFYFFVNETKPSTGNKINTYLLPESKIYTENGVIYDSGSDSYTVEKKLLNVKSAKSLINSMRPHTVYIGTSETPSGDFKQGDVYIQY